MKQSLALLLALLLVLPVHAGDDDKKKPQTEPTPASLRAQLLHSASMSTQVVAFDANLQQRSIPLAFGLSAILPGAGQAYNRQWVKAAVLIAVEAALITGYSTWRSQGLDGERDFQAFAHAEWDPAQYGAWLNDYKAFQIDSGLKNISAPDAVIPTGIDFTRPDSWSANERRAVDEFFSQIRAIERQSVDADTRATFSHVLPFHGEQQYYELVGKYFQFAPGWVDYPDWRNPDGTFNAAINPEEADANDDKVHVSDTFYRYADDHAEANEALVGT